uniref:Uncharacterized protein n=1 Tax=Megaviridae environmental sample TaxID=1737588 RepID=A0A5J6VND2_9VIRU|nr:MAG: hypothetical protein [Megaviridae environmental sample]
MRQSSSHQSSHPPNMHPELSNLCGLCTNIAKRSLEFKLPYNTGLPAHCRFCNNLYQELSNRPKFFKNKKNYDMYTTIVPLSVEANDWQNSRRRALCEDEDIMQTTNINKYRLNSVYSYTNDNNDELFKFEVIELYTDTHAYAETRPGFCVIRYIDETSIRYPINNQPEIDNENNEDYDGGYDDNGDWYWYDYTGWWYSDMTKYSGFWKDTKETPTQKWEREQQARIDKERSEDKIRAKTTMNSLKELRFWFDDDLSSKYYNQAEMLAMILRESQKWSTIRYEDIDCSYFMYLSIYYFNIDAGLALLNATKHIEAFIQKEFNVYVSNPYPLAIHFAVLAKYPEVWTPELHKYFERVNIHTKPLDTLQPGTIIAWAYNSFLNKKSVSDTGHVGMVSSMVSQNNKFYMTHSIPKEKDIQKKRGGICTTIFSTTGRTLDQIRSYKIIGGGFKLKNTKSPNRFDQCKHTLLPPKSKKIDNTMSVSEKGRTIINELRSGLL